MFFIIPIGSEEGVRRLPYLTIGLIVINTIIWIITASIHSGQMNEIENLDRQLFQIEQRYFYKLLEEDPHILTTIDYNEIRERFRTEGIIPIESHDYEEWQRLYAEYTSKHSITIFEQFGFKPKRFDFLRMFSSMFLHGNFFHLLFNMLFLWMVGCNIEDDWGWKVFLGLYLVSGIVACLFHAAAFPQSTVPLIGASGAIAGVMGAFMIRHYKTKIRFAYFLWFFIRPFFGTFALYAGIALPFWFLEQIISAHWGGETGTAYWAHIGGFIFGAGIGVSLKFFGLEKKYITPIVEDSFERLKLSPTMKEVYRKLDTGDTAGATPLLLQLLDEEPENFDAPLILARFYFEKGNADDAMAMYNRSIDTIMRAQNSAVALSVYEELKDKKLIGKLSEKNIYNLATLLEQKGTYDDAATLFGSYVKLFPDGKVRAKAIYRTYLLFKNKIHDEVMAQSALAFLQNEYPDFPITA
jgi:membrane associated rhomboid family serine protease